MLAVRSSHGLEIPLADQNGELLVDRKYLNFITALANRKLRENQTRHLKFLSKLKEEIKVKECSNDETDRRAKKYEVIKKIRDVNQDSLPFDLPEYMTELLEEA